MKIKKNNFIIIITTLGINNSLRKVYESLLSQKYKPKKIIISSFKKLSNFFDCDIVYSSVQNQVYQRTKAIKKAKINKNDILVFLDDKIILEKNCLYELNKEWNSSRNEVAGIGISCKNYTPPKINIGQKISLTNSSEIGKIIKNGFVSGYGNIKKNTKVDWLNGGTTSWKYIFIKKNLKRNYPLLKWSVGEDVIFSYNISKRFTLIVSKKAKCKILFTKTKKNIKQSYLIGYSHSYITKSFVKANIENFSILLYYYSVATSSIMGILFNLLRFNFGEVARYLGRITGSLSYYKNIR